jgi:hypothetical protein
MKGEYKMKKKAVIIAGVAALALITAGVTMASPMGRGMMGGGFGWGGGPGRMEPLKLTESQQADWKAWQEKNFQLRKEQVQLMVKSGYLTQEQADAKLKMMDSGHAFRMKNNLVGPGARFTGPLTDDQKADLKKLAEERLNIQKENLARLVSAGQITQAQADARIERMQTRISNFDQKGFGGPGGPGRGGFGGGKGGPGGCRF